jgi:hypothetical protein
MTSKVIVGMLVGLLFVFGVFYLFTQKEEPAEVEEIKVREGVTDDLVPGDIVELGEQIVLTPVGDFKGVGNASRVYEGGHFLHTASASINNPPGGKFYEGWLVKQDPKLEFFSTGRMVKKGNTYYLEFTVDTDLRDYNQVVITQESQSNGLDGVPEIHILEGSF